MEFSKVDYLDPFDFLFFELELVDLLLSNSSSNSLVLIKYKLSTTFARKNYLLTYLVKRAAATNIVLKSPPNFESKSIMVYLTYLIFHD